MKECLQVFKDYYDRGKRHRSITITVFKDPEPVMITSEKIVYESLRLTQTLCDEADIRFGGACSSSFEIDLFGVEDLTGEYITVTLTESLIVPTYPSMTTYPGQAYPGYTPISYSTNIFSGEVYSCRFAKDKITRHLIAYDRLYWRGSLDCTAWYKNGSFWHQPPGTSFYYTTVYELRKAICEQFDIVEQYPNDVLPTDTIEIEPIEGNVTVAQLLHDLCEMNGVFCVLNGTGNLQYHTLSTNDTITNIRKPSTEVYGTVYADCEYEEYEKEFTGIAWVGKNGVWVGFSTNNAFYVINSENKIMNAYGGYTTWSIELDRTGIDELLKAVQVSAVPMTLKVPFRSWVEVGDLISFQARSFTPDGSGGYSAAWKTITTPILTRTVNGLHAMTDEFSTSAENVKVTEENVFGGE